MSTEFACSIKRIRFDENYQPADNTRLTTNFANLARGESREQNLRNTFRMINNRFNALAQTDNPNGDRYSLEIDIISANLDIEGNGKTFPIIEMLKSTITDHHTNQRIEGMIGNSFSSYVRDYDFSVVLKEHNKENSTSNTCTPWPTSWALRSALPARPLTQVSYPTTCRWGKPVRSSLRTFILLWVSPVRFNTLPV